MTPMARTLAAHQPLPPRLPPLPFLFASMVLNSESSTDPVPCCALTTVCTGTHTLTTSAPCALPTSLPSEWCCCPRATVAQAMSSCPHAGLPEPLEGPTLALAVGAGAAAAAAAAAGGAAWVVAGARPLPGPLAGRAQRRRRGWVRAQRALLGLNLATLRTSGGCGVRAMFCY